MSSTHSTLKRFGPSKLPRSRTAATLMASVAGLAAVVSVSVLTYFTLPRPLDPPQVSGRTAITWLARAGITPKNLAATGADGTAGTAAITAARTYLGENLAALESADAALNSARDTYERMVDKVQSGRATIEEAATLAALKGTYDSAQSNANTAFAALRASALQGLSQDQRTTVDTILGNSRWGLPVQYKVVTRTEEQWVALRDALANVRISGQLGVEPDSACNTAVTEANVNGVATAATSLTNNLEGLQTAWNAANTP